MGAQEGLRGLSYKKGLGEVPASLAGAPGPGPDPDRVSPLWPQVGKLRERLQEAKLEREQEQRRHTAYISELRAKLHEEKTKELQALREVLIRQHEQEAARTAKIKEGELQRLQATLNVLRDGAADKVKTALLADAREEARRAFDGERLRLQQEILELKAARKQAEEALSNCMQADKTKAADLRAAYQAHQDEVHRIKRECERDIRRLVRVLPRPALRARRSCSTRTPALPTHARPVSLVHRHVFCSIYRHPVLPAHRQPLLLCTRASSFPDSCVWPLCKHVPHLPLLEQ